MQKANAVLLLYSGSPRAGNLHEQLANFGFNVVPFDIITGTDCDLSDDVVWLPILKRITDGEIFAAVVSPPCSTFSRLRQKPGGPPQLRGVHGKDRYGLA